MSEGQRVARNVQRWFSILVVFLWIAIWGRLNNNEQVDPAITMGTIILHAIIMLLDAMRALAKDTRP